MKHLVKKLSTLFIVAVLAVTMLLPATANAQERTIKYKQNLVLNLFSNRNIFYKKYHNKYILYFPLKQFSIGNIFNYNVF